MVNYTFINEYIWWRYQFNKCRRWLRKSYNLKLKNKAEEYIAPWKSLWTWKEKFGPSQGGKPKSRVGSCYLSESKFDSSLFKGLGKLLKLLKVTGLLQAGSINSLWCWLALWKCLNWGCCYCACWGCWLLEKEQKNKNKHIPRYLSLEGHE